jgi:hypothetical protein
VSSQVPLRLNRFQREKQTTTCQPKIYQSNNKIFANTNTEQLVMIFSFKTNLIISHSEYSSYNRVQYLVDAAVVDLLLLAFFCALGVLVLDLNIHFFYNSKYKDLFFCKYKNLMIHVGHNQTGKNKNPKI